MKTKKKEQIVSDLQLVLKTLDDQIKNPKNKKNLGNLENAQAITSALIKQIGAK